jgi:UDP-2,3-diacylglucosamine pyrophosphatase LpxH
MATNSTRGVTRISQKIIPIFLVLSMLLTLSACGTEKSSPTELETSAAPVTSLTSAAPTPSDNTTGALWTPADSADKIVVISDIHLGIEDQYTQSFENRQLLLDFLERLGSTTDVRELVINGDLLDEWYLPLTYARYDDSSEFYRQVIANNQDVFDALNSLMAKGIRLVYVPGNHDMLLESEILDEALPGIVQARDAEGLGVYVTGDRQEIAIEHSHRYDVFSAPDSVSNQELCQNDDTLLPPGYFYARIATSWVLQGRPLIKKDYPLVAAVPDAVADPEQYGAYLYYKVWSSLLMRMTQFERFEDKIFDLGIAGFDGSYTLEDLYPVQQADGTISAPVLFTNFQRSWEGRQEINQVAVKVSFNEAVAGTLSYDYFYSQAKKQYLQNPEKFIDVVVFGHTHVPDFRNVDNKYYVNSGTWIDNNSSYPDATRTFAVITTGDVDGASVYEYMPDGSVLDITDSVSGE